jgi:hypothetical protein
MAELSRLAVLLAPVLVVPKITIEYFELIHYRGACSPNLAMWVAPRPTDGVGSKVLPRSLMFLKVHLES